MQTIITYLCFSLAAYSIPNEGKPVTVVVFLGTECPLAKLYAGRLNEMASQFSDAQFVIVNSNEQDTLLDIEEFKASHSVSIPVLKDDGTIADQFGATRTPEAFVLDKDRAIRYRGRIDDQYVPGARKPQASSQYVVDAVEALLAGESVKVTETEPVGCFIGRRQKAKAAVVTYNDVAPIFYKRCVSCHRSGEVAPFSMASYADTVSWAPTIREVIEQKRMPPWSADPQHGTYSNDPTLSKAEQDLVFAWVDAGSPEGNPADCPSLPVFSSGWEIEPDAVFKAEAFTLPAEGLLDYQEFVVNPGWYTDTWVQAVQILPGNKSVVHHATIYLKPKYAQKDKFYATPASDNFLALYVPGNTSLTLPAGMAKRVPAGWNMVLSVHYVTTGKVETDQISIGIQYAKGDVRHEVASRCLTPEQFELQPGEVRTIVAEGVMSEDMTLIALFPHMHLRGRSMLFEAMYPDGRSETLLNVASYDFEWQHRYVLAEAKSLPKGTRVRCTAVYDNSAANPYNPDPAAVVRTGWATEDEMFLGVFELAGTVKEKKSWTWTIVGLVAFLIVNRMRGRK